MKSWLAAVVLALGFALSAHAQESSSATESAAPAEATTDAASIPSTEATTDTTAPMSVPGTEPTTDAESVPSTEATTETTGEVSVPGSEPTTDASVEPTPETSGPSVESSPGTTPTTGVRGQAATFRLKFAPVVGGPPRRLTESNSEQMHIVLPPLVEGAPPEERSRLTTTSIVSTVAFETTTDGGFRQIEIVQQYKRFEEGLAMPDPLENALRGSKLTTKLDANGAFLGVEDPQGFLDGLVAHAPEAERPALQAALSADAIEHEAREGWQRKVGRYLSVPLRVGHPTFLIEYEDMGEAGRMPYVLCALPSTIEPVGGKPCIHVDLVSFAATLKDGVVSGVPEEVESEFMQWVEGKDIPFSPVELSVWGAGEVVLELSGTGTVRYSNEENFHLAPARITRPMGGTVEAEELSVKRVAKQTLE